MCEVSSGPMHGPSRRPLPHTEGGGVQRGTRGHRERMAVGVEAECSGWLGGGGLTQAFERG